MFQIRRNDNKNHTIIEEARAKKERHFIKSERMQKLIPGAEPILTAVPCAAGLWRVLRH